MTFHHDKHHQAYVNNLNAAIDKANNLDANDVKSQIELQSVIKFNGGGHINHSHFWLNLAPTDSEPTKGGYEVKKQISTSWGSIDQFETEFTNTLLGIQGSEWAWLVEHVDGSLVIETTKDQDPVTQGVALLGVDFWEHAISLDQNDKGSYVHKYL